MTWDSVPGRCCYGPSSVDSFLIAEPLPPSAVSRSAVFLHPGQLFASSTPHEVSTLLGSCVAVCLYDELLKMGGMNHFLLPNCPDSQKGSPRFAPGAVACLLGRMLQMGCNKSQLSAKVFGGACVLRAFRETSDVGHLGERNAEAACALLRSHGIAIAAQDTGGYQGRKLMFHTDDGSAFVKGL